MLIFLNLKCSECGKQCGEKMFNSYDEYSNSTETCECGGKLIRDWMGKGCAAIWSTGCPTASYGKGVK